MCRGRAVAGVLWKELQVSGVCVCVCVCVSCLSHLTSHRAAHCVTVCVSALAQMCAWLALPALPSALTAAPLRTCRLSTSAPRPFVVRCVHVFVAAACSAQCCTCCTCGAARVCAACAAGCVAAQWQCADIACVRVCAGALAAAGVAPDAVEETIFGNVMSAGLGQVRGRRCVCTTVAVCPI